MNNNAILRVERPSFYGCVLSIHINIDGYVYDVKTGAPLELQIVPGVHNIILDVPKAFGIANQQQLQINAAPGGVYVINLKGDWLLGGFKINEKKSKLI